MNKQWNQVISQIDNWIYILFAVGVYCAAKYLEVPELNVIAGACLVKIRAPENEGINTDNKE